jgi:DNA-binding FadR family transcriptional regulator
MGLDTTRPIAVSDELHRIYDQISRHDLDGATAAIESMMQQVESAASDPEIVKARLLIQRKAILGK